MKFADIECQRREAQGGLSATCPSCGAAVIAKCGDHRVWHWAHRGVRVCDPWWEPETEWHRAWKNEFPAVWQEAIQFAQTGEKHVADVKTQSGMVIEFQHSFLKAEERAARESFYRKMVWVVDGRRRKRDAAQLSSVSAHACWPTIHLYVANHHEECACCAIGILAPCPSILIWAPRRMERTSFGGAIHQPKWQSVFNARVAQTSCRYIAKDLTPRRSFRKALA